HDQIHPQHLHCLEGRILNGARSHEGDHDSNDVNGQLELEELGDRVVHVATPHHYLDDGGEVIISEDDIRCFLRHISTSDT
ncbi:hypothetical protein PMAYCL1PPCAC_18716, partial [Pristionchus mayeri]